MKTIWKSGLMTVGMLLVVSNVSSAGNILDRIESGRRQIKGLPPERTSVTRVVRVPRTTYSPMMVAARPSRVSYSSAFQSPAAEIEPISPSAEIMVVAPQSGGYRHSGSGIPSAFDRSFKGTYRNSR